jgi:hypothetical protein
VSIGGGGRVFIDLSGLGFCERQSSLEMTGLYARHSFPTANGDIDVERIKFDDAGDPARTFSGQNCRPASPKRVKNEPLPATAVADQICDQGNGFDGGM